MHPNPESTDTPHSGLSADAILQLTLPHYAVPPPLQCRFLTRGMHDNYLVESAKEKYILRVYRNRSRSADEILFELELLDHLHRQGCPVAHPLRTTASEWWAKLRTPHAEHVAVLFTHATGRAPGRAIEPHQCLALGQTLARIHHAADSFRTAHTRQVLDLDYLLDASLDAIVPYLTREQREATRSLQQRLRNALPGLPRHPPWFGPCTGDVNPQNFHVDDQGHITVFDFDQCGLGWRAFEIGKFHASLPYGAEAEALRAEFLRGYESVRPLEPDERRAVRHFMLVACIWVMALHVYNADLAGPLIADPGFWSRKLQALRELEFR